jgi:hypothetical protein
MGLSPPAVDAGVAVVAVAKDWMMQVADVASDLVMASGLWKDVEE